MIIYQDDLVIVSSGWLRGWRVKNRKTGATFVPPREMRERIGRLWYAVRVTHRSASLRLQASEDLLMLQFALCVMDPSSDLARDFVSQDLDEQAQTIILHANVMLVSPSALDR